MVSTSASNRSITLKHYPAQNHSHHRRSHGPGSESPWRRHGSQRAALRRSLEPPAAPGTSGPRRRQRPRIQPRRIGRRRPRPAPPGSRPDMPERLRNRQPMRSQGRVRHLPRRRPQHRHWQRGCQQAGLFIRRTTGPYLDRCSCRLQHAGHLPFRQHPRHARGRPHPRW